MRHHHLRRIRNKTDIRLDYLLLAIILLVAAVLRLWKLGQVPFMHDEFSALGRTDFDNLHDLVTKGILVDTHPAGIQFFLYLWVKIFGWSEFWVKLPFALMGIVSIYLIYVVGKQWFNSKVGLLSAAFFAVSQFTVFYSQLARPYIAGLFAVLLFAVFWNKILFDDHKPKVGTCIGFAIAAALAALTHSFSTAQAGLLFLTGLFFLPKDRRKAYWLSGIGAVLLYSPNLPIFYHQLIEEGGIGGWLTMPKPSFLLDFVQYTMNYAPLFMFTVGILILLPLILGRRQKRRYPIRWAAIAWFLIAYGVAYVYSLLREPILQQSTLIFSYPFVVIVAFSLYKNDTMTKWQTVAVILILLFVGTSTLVSTRKHYELMYHQGFDQIAVKMQEDQTQYGDAIRFATRTEIGRAAEFYQEPTNIENRIVFDRYTELQDFRDWLSNGDSKLLGFGWTDYVNPIWEITAVANYPYLLYEKDWFTSRYLTLSKDSIQDSTPLVTPLGDSPYVYAEGQEWGNAFTISGDSLDTKTEYFGIIGDVTSHDTLVGSTMVIEVHDAESDSLLFWHGTGNANDLIPPGHNYLVDAVIFNDDLRPQGKTIKVFLWNRGKRPLTLNGISFYTHKESPVLTGLYKPLN